MVQITGLSSALLLDSARVHGPIQVIDVSSKLMSAPSELELSTAVEYDRRPNAPEIRQANVALKEARWERAMAQSEYDILQDTARAGALAEASSTGRLLGTLSEFTQHKRNAVKDMLRLDEDILALEQRIWVLQDAWKGDTMAAVAIIVIAERPGRVDFDLSYRESVNIAPPFRSTSLTELVVVNNVSWEPHYDLQAHTRDGGFSSEITVCHSADIVQRTGE